MGYKYINIYYCLLCSIYNSQIDFLQKFSDKGIYIRRGRDPRTGGGWGGGGVQCMIKKIQTYIVLP